MDTTLGETAAAVALQLGACGLAWATGAVWVSRLVAAVGAEAVSAVTSPWGTAWVVPLASTAASGATEPISVQRRRRGGASTAVSAPPAPVPPGPHGDDCWWEAAEGSGGYDGAPAPGYEACWRDGSPYHSGWVGCCCDGSGCCGESGVGVCDIGDGLLQRLVGPTQPHGGQTTLGACW